MSKQSIEPKKVQDEISIRVNLHAYIKKEKEGIFLSYCPVLDLYSQGDTQKEARKNIIEATQMFIESCVEDGTLNSVLHDSGFRLANEKPARKRQSKTNEIFGGRAIKIPTQIPLFATA